MREMAAYVAFSSDIWRTAKFYLRNATSHTPWIQAYHREQQPGPCLTPSQHRVICWAVKIMWTLKSFSFEHQKGVASICTASKWTWCLTSPENIKLIRDGICTTLKVGLFQARQTFLLQAFTCNFKSWIFMGWAAVKWLTRQTHAKATGSSCHGIVESYQRLNQETRACRESTICRLNRSNGPTLYSVRYRESVSRQCLGVFLIKHVCSGTMSRSKLSHGGSVKHKSPCLAIQ